MRDNYLYDVFISYYHEDEENVRPIYEKLTMDFGLRVFWSVRKLPKGVSFPPEIENALLGSQHFVLYFSDKARESEWVGKESRIFHETCHLKDKEHRRMYVLLDPECSNSSIPNFLKDINRPNSTDELMSALIRALGRGFEQTTIEKNLLITDLREQLEQEKQKAAEAQKFYRYNRFWGAVADNRDIHIFTCGRDAPHGDDGTRGYGGRTNIDMWDYRAVLDITHFFASNYPNTKVTIEDPRSKLHGRDLEEYPHLAKRISELSRMLENKDCIIIGSPDVSDYAEIVLAEIHKIDPYTESRLKKKGFVLIKEQKYTQSSFYWQKEKQQSEGIVEILDEGEHNFYYNEPATEDGNPGLMFGILIVANNPFCTPNLQRKIIILSGFSGVATNGIAKILTDDKYLNAFFRLDSEFINLERNIEALIGVKYAFDSNIASRDTRRIIDSPDAITFERLIEI